MLRRFFTAITVFTLFTASVCFAQVSQATPVSCADGGECHVGDIGPGGGVVFYVKGTGNFHRESSRQVNDMMMGFQTQQVSVDLTSDQQAELGFDYLEAAGGGSIVEITWGSSAGEVLNLPRTIGSGASNTQALLSGYPSDTAENNAAHYASTYSHNGLSDWFLPSMDELALVTVEHVAGTLGEHDPIPNLFYGTTSGDPNENNIVRIDEHFWNKDYNVNISGTVQVLPIRAFSAVTADETVEKTVNNYSSSPHNIKRFIVFERGASTLTTSAKAKIRRLVLTQGKKAKFQVAGVVGLEAGVTKQQAKKLAKNRANSLRNYLAKLGVSKTNIQITIKLGDATTVPKSFVNSTR